MQCIRVWLNWLCLVSVSMSLKKWTLEFVSFCFYSFLCVAFPQRVFDFQKRLKAESKAKQPTAFEDLEMKTFESTDFIYRSYSKNSPTCAILHPCRWQISNSCIPSCTLVSVIAEWPLNGFQRKDEDTAKMRHMVYILCVYSSYWKLYIYIYI